MAMKFKKGDLVQHIHSPGTLCVEATIMIDGPAGIERKYLLRHIFQPGDEGYPGMASGVVDVPEMFLRKAK